ncbi:glycoside hydrolase family 13 protein, partial [Laetiporus sulphureus 93-53]
MLRSLLVSCLLAAPSLAATADEWRSRSIYQLMTDRFATSDGSSPPCDVASRKYCGGTWKGIESRLDYIQHMGFDAVWISPIVANIEGETYYGEAYPGYWPVDQNALNGHFGSASDLTSLSSALHSRGMYLMLDLTINH